MGRSVLLLGDGLELSDAGADQHLAHVGDDLPGDLLDLRTRQLEHAPSDPSICSGVSSGDGSAGIVGAARNGLRDRQQGEHALRDPIDVGLVISYGCTVMAGGTGSTRPWAAAAAASMTAMADIGGSGTTSAGGSAATAGSGRSPRRRRLRRASRSAPLRGRWGSSRRHVLVGDGRDRLREVTERRSGAVTAYAGPSTSTTLVARAEGNVCLPGFRRRCGGRLAPRLADRRRLRREGGAAAREASSAGCGSTGGGDPGGRTSFPGRSTTAPCRPPGEAPAGGGGTILSKPVVVKSSPGTPSGTPMSLRGLLLRRLNAHRLARPISCSTVSMSSLASNGFVMIASQPDAIARSRSNGSNVPVSSTTGMCSRAGSLFKTGRPRTRSCRASRHRRG